MFVDEKFEQIETGIQLLVLCKAFYSIAFKWKYEKWPLYSKW